MDNPLVWTEQNLLWMGWGGFKKIVKIKANQTNQIWLGWVLNLVKTGPNQPANTPNPMLQPMLGCS